MLFTCLVAEVLFNYNFPTATQLTLNDSLAADLENHSACILALFTLQEQMDTCVYVYIGIVEAELAVHN